MKYKGYTGVVELDEGSEVLFGHVIGLRDVITFEGESVAEVTQAFHDSVDFYLDFCAERGESPEKPYSGQFVLRLDAQLHRELAHAAEARKMSLNALIEGTLEKVFLASAVVTSRAPDENVFSASAATRRTAAGFQKLGRLAAGKTAGAAPGKIASALRRIGASDARPATRKAASASAGAVVKKKR